MEGQSASKCSRIPNDSKHYFSPSNALKTNSIYFLDRKIITVCYDKSKIQTSGRAAPKNSVLEVFLERKTAKKSDFWTFSSKWTSTCCRPTGWFGKISRYADSNVNQFPVIQGINCPLLGQLLVHFLRSKMIKCHPFPVFSGQHWMILEKSLKIRQKSGPTPGALQSVLLDPQICVLAQNVSK